jgi:hypothetical protein
VARKLSRQKTAAQIISLCVASTLDIWHQQRGVVLGRTFFFEKQTNYSTSLKNSFH